MGKYLIGPWRHWFMLIAILAIVWLMGRSQLHIVNYKLFALVLLALSVATVALVVLTRQPGERITRQPMDDAET